MASYLLMANAANIIEALTLKFRQAQTYTQTEVDNALAHKGTAAYVYGQFALKGNQADMTTTLALKANQATT